MIPKNIQPSDDIIQGKGGHEKRTVGAGLSDRATPQLRIQEELVIVGWIFYGRVLHDDMKVIVLERILKRIGVGQKCQESNEQAKEPVFGEEAGHI